MREEKRAGKDVEIFCIEEHLNAKNTEIVDSKCGQDSDCRTKQPTMACGVFSFHWLFTTSLIQLSIYLNKVYQDSAAVKEYYEEKDISACTASSFCLFLPSVMYLLFTVGAYIKDTEDASTRAIATKVVHGLLLVPWQIKERVELLQFSSEHICQKRHLTSDEMKKKSYLERQTALLAFFHQFYAGLIQITLQLHMIISTLDNKKGYNALTEEIIASVLILLSMMAAIRRHDDSKLTAVLALLGWISIMISRTVTLALVSTVIHGWIVLACIFHGIVISLWLSIIAAQTYNFGRTSHEVLTPKKKLALFLLIFSVFGMPSLVFWPIMFELRKHIRVLIYLSVLLLENIFFVCLWIFFKENIAWAEHDYIVIWVMGGCHVIGSVFLLFYTYCKPEYTDYVVYHDMKDQNIGLYGIYFEFCDVAFKLPWKPEVCKNLKTIRENKMASW